MRCPRSNSTWTVPTGNVMGVDTGRFWIEDGLAAGDTRQVRFQSYDDLGQSNPSAYSPAIVGTTIGGDVPAIDEQPKSVTVFGGTPATFSVQAHSQRGEALSYQWFYLDTSNNAYAEWKPIVGETGPDYVIDAAKTQWTGTLFCVDVMDRTVNASGVVPTVRSQPARLGVELTSAIADPDAAAATLRMVPTITLELTPTDGSTIVQHRDEFFVPYGCTFDMTFTVKDAVGRSMPRQNHPLQVHLRERQPQCRERARTSPSQTDCIRFKATIPPPIQAQATGPLLLREATARGCSKSRLAFRWTAPR